MIRKKIYRCPYCGKMAEKRFNRNKTNQRCESCRRIIRRADVLAANSSLVFMRISKGMVC